MDNIGAEVGQKMRSAIKAKLMELGCYVDDELPDYIMVMVANKRTKSQMNEDLQLFLTTQTSVFVDWLQIVLKKLKEITVTNPDIYKRASKRKADDSHANVKVKKEKKAKVKSNKKAKRKDVKSIIRDIPEIKSLTDDLPVEASKLSEMRKIVVMQENQNSNSNLESVNDCFDIPPLSEVAISNENELVELEKKIKNVKSRLGLQVASDSDEDFINLKAEPEDLFPNEQIHESKHRKIDDNASRKIKLINRSNSGEELSSVANDFRESETSVSPKSKSEHPRIVFGREHLFASKKQSALERLGRRTNSEELNVEFNQKHQKKINLVSIRKQEEELLGLTKSNKPSLLRNRTDDTGTKTATITKLNTTDCHRESALKRLGVMSKVALPPKEDIASEEETLNKDVPSAIKVKPRVMPPSNNQANKNLLLKAVAEAQRSVAQTPIVGNNAKPDALFTKKFRDRITHPTSSSRKLSDKEKNKIKHILVQADKKDKRDLDSSDDDNLEYVPRPLKQVRRSSEHLEYIPSSKDHSSEDYMDSDADPSVLPRESKGQTFIITLDGIARQQERGKSSSPKKNIQPDVKGANKINVGEEKKRKSPSPIIFDKIGNISAASKLKQIPDKLPVIIPPPSLKTKEKCKYWPGCRQGEKCDFVHPNTPCKTFPQCKFGDKCLYIHPMCKFENSCTRKDCPYSHTCRTYNNASNPISSQMCKFFPNCSNTHCMFYHPRPCKYGKYCKNQAECNFAHGFATKSNFTWRSTVKL